MNCKFKYIKWIFDLQMWISAIITLVLGLIIDDWLRANYGMHYRDNISGGHFLSSLFFSMLFVLINMIVEKINQFVKKNFIV